MKIIFYASIIVSFFVSFSSYSQPSIYLPDELKETINNSIENAENILNDAGLSDSTGNDLMYLVGSKSGIKGKLLEVGTKTISFIDNNGVSYNLSKKDVRFIKTGDGRTITFNIDEDEDYTSSDKPTEKDSGGIGAWGVVGIVLSIFFIIGIIGLLAR